jgi:plasmid stabilization system protein ParE
MRRYEISILPQAMQDMDNLYNYIAFKVMMPLAAIRYYNGLVDTINTLSYLPQAHAISESPLVQRRYGPQARTIRYKKMTIIYNIVGNVVIVRRVLAGALLY